jgi:hypothetical protein
MRALTLISALILTPMSAPVANSQARSTITAGATHPSYCPAKGHALDGVYHPSRLVIMKVCLRASGVIDHIVLEQDGDLHIRFRLTSTYAGLINSVNTAKQHGDLVVEFMPRDGGHLPKPAVGDHVTFVGAWVTDTEHGWNELHPVWREILNGNTYTSGPKNGGSPATDRSANAAADCHDHNHACAGYGH